MGVITRIKAYLSSTEFGLTSQLELSLAISDNVHPYPHLLKGFFKAKKFIDFVTWNK